MINPSLAIGIIRKNNLMLVKNCQVIVAAGYQATNGRDARDGLLRVELQHIFREEANGEVVLLAVVYAKI